MDESESVSEYLKFIRSIWLITINILWNLDENIPYVCVWWFMYKDCKYCVFVDTRYQSMFWCRLKTLLLDVKLDRPRDVNNFKI
jgi:hypothetical protein